MTASTESAAAPTSEHQFSTPVDRRDPDAPATQETAASVQMPAIGTRMSAAEIHDNVVVAADEEMRRPAADLALSAFQAGLMIGFSLLAAAYLASLVGPEHRAAAAAAGYPLGFIFVVLARSQLFTENTLDPLLPLLERRDQHTLRGVIRLWAIVLPGNLLGALAFALIAAHTPMFDDPLRTSLHGVAEHATSGGFGIVFYRAIFGGWLVALMAWLVASTSFTGAQILFVWLTTAPIAAFGFRHAIAGAAEAFYQAATGEATWGAMLGAFLVPAILGNIVGGGVLVALLNHGQVLSTLATRMRRRRGERAATA
ncbi:transporter [Gemmatimonadetes bacterium T265]|nr:transporter [Gemmatimonadetes bacterium T265]